MARLGSSGFSWPPPARMRSVSPEPRHLHVWIDATNEAPCWCACACPPRSSRAREPEAVSLDSRRRRPAARQPVPTGALADQPVRRVAEDTDNPGYPCCSARSILRARATSRSARWCRSSRSRASRPHRRRAAGVIEIKASADVVLLVRSGGTFWPPPRPSSTTACASSARRRRRGQRSLRIASTDFDRAALTHLAAIERRPRLARGFARRARAALADGRARRAKEHPQVFIAGFNRSVAIAMFAPRGARRPRHQRGGQRDAPRARAQLSAAR